MAGMGDWRVWLSGLSAAAPYLAERQAARRQDAELARGEALRAQRQAQIDQSLAAEIAGRARSAEPERQVAATDYAAALARARAADPATQVAPAAVGGARFAAESAAARSGVANYGNRLAGLQARADAPLRKRAAEGRSGARTMAAVRTQARMAEGDDYIARARAMRHRANPWLAFMSRIAGQIGEGYVKPGEELALEEPKGNTKKPDAGTKNRRGG